MPMPSRSLPIIFPQGGWENKTGTATGYPADRLFLLILSVLEARVVSRLALETGRPRIKLASSVVSWPTSRSAQRKQLTGGCCSNDECERSRNFKSSVWCGTILLTLFFGFQLLLRSCCRQHAAFLCCAAAVGDCRVLFGIFCRYDQGNPMEYPIKNFVLQRYKRSFYAYLCFLDYIFFCWLQNFDFEKLLESLFWLNFWRQSSVCIWKIDRCTILFNKVFNLVSTGKTFAISKYFDLW